MKNKPFRPLERGSDQREGFARHVPTFHALTCMCNKSDARDWVVQ